MLGWRFPWSSLIETHEIKEHKETTTDGSLCEECEWKNVPRGQVRRHRSDDHRYQDVENLGGGIELTSEELTFHEYEYGEHEPSGVWNVQEPGEHASLKKFPGHKYFLQDDTHLVVM